MRRRRLRANLWALCHEAIDDGLVWGFVRWYKHREKEALCVEDEDALKSHLSDALAHAFSERFRWEDE